MPTAYYAVYATDRPGHAEVRTATREVHRQHLRRQNDDGLQVVCAGPTLGADGAMNGTMLVVRATSIASVERFMAADPYLQADLFERVEIREWNCGLARPELLPARP